MPSNSYDFVILGGGSAGYAAARTAAELGLSVAVLDNARELGGLCILRGCMPSKALIETANRARSIRRAPEFGLRSGELEVHAPEIIERKRRLVEEFASYRRDQLHKGNFDLIRGKGTYVGPHQIEVTPHEGPSFVLEARTSLISTGSEVSVPDIEGLADSGYLTSDSLLELERVPASVTVLGGGAIALEMAHYLEALGSKVTVIQRSSHVLSDLDADLAIEVEQAFRERGMDLFCGTSLQKVEQTSSGKRVTLEHEGQSKMVESDELLLVLGRHPAIGGLQLAKAGISDQKRVEVAHTQMSTQVPGIFAAGDVCSPVEVVHIAIEQGEIAAHNAAVHLGKAAGPMKEMDYRLTLFGVFTEPEVAVVGALERDLQAQSIPYQVAKERFDDHGKSMVMGDLDGFVKLLVDPISKKILGASVVGPHAVDLIHEVVLAMYFEGTAGDLARAPHYHPTLSEIWTYPAEELAG